MEWLTAWLQVFLLCLVRVGGCLLLVPVLGGRQIPSTVKVGVLLALSLFCFRWALPLVPASPLPLAAFALCLVKEAAVGLALGLTLMLAIAAIQAAGELLGFQMMFSAASVFSMFTFEQTTVVGDLFYLLAMLVFLSLDGHHAVINGLDFSFQTLPVLGWPAGWGAPGAWISLAGRIFTIGLQLALPLAAALLITNLSLGMIARTLPQINIFVIGLPVQIAAGLVILWLIMGSLLQSEGEIFRQWARELHGLIRMLGA